MKKTSKGKPIKLKKAKKELKPEGAKAKQNLGKFARGGAAKHKTQVNVIVGGGKQPVPVPVPSNAPPTGGMPQGSPPPMMPPRGMPPSGAPMGGPSTGMMPPSRPGMKHGGKVPDFKGGAGGGLGRLEKAEDAKKIK